MALLIYLYVSLVLEVLDINYMERDLEVRLDYHFAQRYVLIMYWVLEDMGVRLEYDLAQI